MAVVQDITIPNGDLADVLSAIEKVWKPDAVRMLTAVVYEALGPAQKVRACTIAMYRVRTRSYRREQAERGILTTDPDVN